MKNNIILLCLLTVLVTGCGTVRQNLNQVDGPLINQNNTENFNVNQANPGPAVVPTSTVKEIKTTTTTTNNVQVPKDNADELLPKEVNLKVLFGAQAPYQVWDAFHEETCEEAAIIMAVKYFKEEPLNAHIMEQALLDLVDWEEANGYKVDITADETLLILRDYFGLKAQISAEVNKDRIKRELADGNLIIVPTAGRLLGNPNFKQPGPIYHMLVVRGYNESEFITNDPGTRKGEGYVYKYQTLINAVHDWNHEMAEGGMTDEEMEQGRKVMIIVEGLQ